MKLQQAYFSESNQAGGWQLIGYMAPSGAAASETTNFAYGVGGISKGETVTLDATGKVGWTAKNKIALNECQIPSDYNWSVTVKLATTGDNGKDVGFTSAAKGTGCISLTPSFEKIGQ